MVIFYVLNNNFFYTQVAFTNTPVNTDTFFLFLLQKSFDTFHVLLSGAFLCVFDNIYLFLYIEKNIYKKIIFCKLQK